MKQPERDKVLLEIVEDIGRLKETAHNTYHLIEKVEQHMTEQNGRVRSNTVWRRIGFGVGGSLLLLMAGWLFWLTVAI